MLSVSAHFRARSGCMLLGGGRLFVLSSLVVMVTYSAAAMADSPPTPEDGLNFLPHEVLSEIIPPLPPPAAFRQPIHHRHHPRFAPNPNGPPPQNQIRGRVVPGQHGSWSGNSGLTSSGTGVFLPKPRAYAAAVPNVQNRSRKKGGNKGNDNIEPSSVKKTGDANKQVTVIEKEKKEKEEFFEFELQKDKYLLLPMEWSYLPV